MTPTAPWFRTSSAWSRVQNSLRLVEQMIARDTSPEASPENSPASPESSTNIIVLHDVSHRYMQSGAALRACHVNLGIALRSLLDADVSDPRAASLPAHRDAMISARLFATVLPASQQAGRRDRP